MGGRKRKTAQPGAGAGTVEAKMPSDRSMGSSSKQPEIRISAPPTQQSDASPSSGLDPFPQQREASAARDLQHPSQRNAAVPVNSHRPASGFSTEESSRYLVVPQVHALAQSQYDRLKSQASPSVADDDEKIQPAAYLAAEALVSSFNTENPNPKFLPPVFCCSRVHASTPFTTAKDIRDRFDRYKTEFTEEIRTFDWQIVGLRVQGNNLETMTRSYWGHNRQRPNHPIDEELKKQERELKELKELKEELSSAQEDRNYLDWELKDNERAHAHYMRNHEDHEPQFRHFSKGASTSVPEKASKGPFNYVIQVTEDVTFHEKELYAMVTKEQKRQDKEEEE